MSLIVRLCLLVFVAVSPAAVIQRYHELELRRRGELQVHAEAARLAQFAAGEMARIIEGARILLLASALEPAVRAMDAAACADYVERISRLMDPLYGGLMMLDRTGQPRLRRPVRAGGWDRSRP